MDANIARRLFNGLGANAYGQLVTIVVQLVGVPLLLHAWGAQLYGEWLILSAIPAYLSMTDLGFSQSAGNDMTAHAGRRDNAGALCVFHSLTLMLCLLVAIGIATSSVLVWGLPIDRWIHFRVLDDRAVRWILWLLTTQVFFGLLDGINHAGFRASGDYALHVGLNSTVRLLQFGSVCVVALVGASPVAAAAAFFGIRALGTTAFALLLVRRHHWLHFGFALARRAELRRLFKPALAYTAMPLAQALNMQGVVLVVGAFLGPLAVVAFSTLRTLTRLVLQLALAVSHAAEPEMAAAYGGGDRELLSSLFTHVLRAGLWLGLAAALGLAVFGRWLVDMWTHGQVQFDSVLFAWLLVSVVANLMWSAPRIVLQAANLHLHAASLYVLASAAAVGLAALLLSATGKLANAGFALLVIDATMAVYTLRAVGALLGLNPVASLLQAANPASLFQLARGHISRRQRHLHQAARHSP